MKKKHLEISLFYTSVPETMILCYTVPKIWHLTDVSFIFHFGLFFAIIFFKKKNKKTTWGYHHFTGVLKILIT